MRKNWTSHRKCALRVSELEITKRLMCFHLTFLVVTIAADSTPQGSNNEKKKICGRKKPTRNIDEPAIISRLSQNKYA